MASELENFSPSDSAGDTSVSSSPSQNVYAEIFQSMGQRNEKTESTMREQNQSLMKNGFPNVSFFDSKNESGNSSMSQPDHENESSKSKSDGVDATSTHNGQSEQKINSADRTPALTSAGNTPDNTKEPTNGIGPPPDRKRDDAPQPANQPGEKNQVTGTQQSPSHQSTDHSPPELTGPDNTPGKEPTIGIGPPPDRKRDDAPQPADQPGEKDQITGNKRSQGRTSNESDVSRLVRQNGQVQRTTSPNGFGTVRR